MVAAMLKLHVIAAAAAPLSAGMAAAHSSPTSV